MTNRRYLGIDYGTKRIGLALSDMAGKIAFPKDIISNDKNTLSKIQDLASSEGITDIVIGESLDFSGKPNPLSDDIDKFVKVLSSELGLPVHKQKEFLTTVEARKTMHGSHPAQKQSHNRIKKVKAPHIDQVAAALILQRYLDKSNK